MNTKISQNLLLFTIIVPPLSVYLRYIYIHWRTVWRKGYDRITREIFFSQLVWEYSIGGPTLFLHSSFGVHPPSSVNWQRDRLSLLPLPVLLLKLFILLWVLSLGFFLWLQSFLLLPSLHPLRPLLLLMFSTFPASRSCCRVSVVVGLLPYCQCPCSCQRICYGQCFCCRWVILLTAKKVCASSNIFPLRISWTDRMERGGVGLSHRISGSFPFLVRDKYRRQSTNPSGIGKVKGQCHQNFVVNGD